MMYRLEKKIDGKWYTEGTYPEEMLTALVKDVLYNLSYGRDSIEDIRVVKTTKTVALSFTSCA